MKSEKPRRVGASSPTSTHNLTSMARQERVLQLRMAGLDFATIAKEVGYGDKSGAHHALTAAMKAAHGRIDKQAEEYRQLLLLRLERLVRAHWMLAMGQPERGQPGQLGYQPAMPPSLKAADRILKTIDREMALVGLTRGGAAQPTTPEELAAKIREALGGIEAAFEPPGEDDDDA